MSDEVWRVLLGLALIVTIWRVTRLLIVDEFPPVRIVREAFLRLGVVDAKGNLTGGRGPRWISWLTHAAAYVWTCPWCMSVWAGAAVVAIADVRFSVPLPWCLVAIASLVAGRSAQAEAEHEQRWKLAQYEIDERGD